MGARELSWEAEWKMCSASGRENLGELIYVKIFSLGDVLIMKRTEDIMC